MTKTFQWFYNGSPRGTGQTQVVGAGETNPDLWEVRSEVVFGTEGVSALSGFALLAVEGVWSITAGDGSAAINSFPPVPTSPAWNITVGPGSATITSFPGAVGGGTGNVSASPVDDRTLQIVWDAPSSGLPSSYNLRHRLLGATTWTEIVGVSSPYNLTALPIGGADYEIEIGAVFGASVTWSDTAVAATHVRAYGIDAEWNLPISAVLGRGTNPYEAYFRNVMFNNWVQPGWINFFDRDYTYPVYDAADAGGATATVVAGDGNWNGQQIPWDPSWTIPGGTDQQIIVLDKVNGIEWNAWQVSYSASLNRLTCSRCNRISAGTGTTGPVGDFRTKTNGFRQSRGCGLQYLVGLIRPEEIAQGKIYHALSMVLEDSAFTLYCNPATKGEEFAGNTDTLSVPQGTRFYLDVTDAEIDAHVASWPAGVPTATRNTMRIVFQAMRDYGVVCTDQGGANHIQFQHDASTDWGPFGLTFPGGAGFTASNGKEYPRDAIDGFVSISKIKIVRPPDGELFKAENPRTPLVLTAPVIAGTGAVGQTLTCTTQGLLIGEHPLNTTRQWRRNGIPISGATGLTYVTQGADVGTTITLAFIGSNLRGTTPTVSNGISVT